MEIKIPVQMVQCVGFFLFFFWEWDGGDNVNVKGSFKIYLIHFLS